jgi:3-hydroxymyristoyl/3-hydroxydecanoyl-(acyl carrier protein) dehydratase
MLPMADFDDPAAVRERFQLLCAGGAPENRFPGVTNPEVVPTEHVPGERLDATLRVPESAPFFEDHFPRRPVFPATLLLNTQTALALLLAGESSDWAMGPPVHILRVLDVKMRTFIHPGQELELRVELSPPEQGVATARLSARMDGRSVAVARAELGPRGSAT